jgi:hypothetical protein
MMKKDLKNRKKTLTRMIKNGSNSAVETSLNMKENGLRSLKTMAKLKKTFVPQPRLRKETRQQLSIQLIRRHQ